MASSGSWTYTVDPSIMNFTVAWSQTKNLAANKSTVSVTVNCNHNPAEIKLMGIRLTCFGQIYDKDSWFATSRNDTLVLSKSFTVSHNADGTKSGSIVLSVYNWIAPTVGEAGQEFSTSRSITLDRIYGATTPTLSASSVNMGSALTITATNQSYTHTLQYECTNGVGTQSGTITTGLSGSFSWTVPTALATLTPNATELAVTLKCITYSGSTQIGTKYVVFTAVVPNNATFQPNASVTVFDPTSIYSTYGSYVKGMSYATITTTASGKSGATIASYRTTANGITSYDNPRIIELPNAGTVPISVVVTDSRGFTKTVTTSINVIDYVVPTINSMTAYRCNANGVANDEGTYIKVTYTFAITPLNSHNGKSAVTSYKQSGSSVFIDADTYTSAYSGTRSIVIGSGGISLNNAFNVRLTVSDDFVSVFKNIDISTAFALMDFRNTGKGVGIGQVASKDRLQVGMIAELNNDVYLAPDSDGQKKIIFENPGTFGTTHHSCFIYGGDGLTATGIGIWDSLHSKQIFTYNDVTNKLYSSSPMNHFYIQTRPPSVFTIPTSNDTTVPMTYIETENDQEGILSVSDNGILCSVDGSILVAASVLFTDNVIPGQAYYIRIKRNSQIISQSLTRMPDTYHSVHVPLSVTKVSAGDLITLEVATSANVKIYNGERSTLLTVVYIA